MAISHLTYIKDASGLAQAKGLPSLIYHEPAIEVKFMRGAAGTTRILTIRVTGHSESDGSFFLRTVRSHSTLDARCNLFPG